MIIYIILFVLLTLFIIFTIILLNLIINQQNTKRSKIRSKKAFFDSSRNNRKARPLEKKLIRLLHGDKATAYRLLENARIKYKDKSENWYLEKVIHDLERDRLNY